VHENKELVKCYEKVEHKKGLKNMKQSFLGAFEDQS